MSSQPTDAQAAAAREVLRAAEEGMQRELGDAADRLAAATAAVREAAAARDAVVLRAVHVLPAGKIHIYARVTPGRVYQIRQAAKARASVEPQEGVAASTGGPRTAEAVSAAGPR